MVGNVVWTTSQAFESVFPWTLFDGEISPQWRCFIANGSLMRAIITILQHWSSCYNTFLKKLVCFGHVLRIFNLASFRVCFPMENLVGRCTSYKWRHFFANGPRIHDMCCNNHFIALVLVMHLFNRLSTSQAFELFFLWILFYGEINPLMIHWYVITHFTIFF